MKQIPVLYSSKLSHLEVRQQLCATLKFGHEFKGGGNVRGSTTLTGFDQLPERYKARVRDADYIVYSYETPIAWRSGAQWYMPDVKYSPSTTRQQGAIHMALSSFTDIEVI